MLNVIYFTALACLFIQLSRMLALRHNVLLDVPNGRKQHHAATPCTGGVGIVIAALAGVALQQASVFQQEPWYFLGLGAIFVLGVLDDLMDLSPKTKLLVELPLISTVLLFFSQYPSFESEHLLPIFWAKWFGVGFAIFLMLGFINALNMTDGVDGLAGFLSLYYAAVCAGLAAALEQTVITYLALGLVGSLIGFLLFNFRTPFGRKALVFLGDSGSMALGFALGWLGLALTQHGLPEVLVLWLMSYPAFDSVSTALRRVMKGKNPMHGDRTHLHHLLPELGFSSAHTVTLIGIVSAGLTTFGFWLWHCQVSSLALFWAWGLTGAFYVVLTIFIESKVTK